MVSWIKKIGITLAILGTAIVFATSVFSVIDYMFFNPNKNLYLLGFLLIAIGVAEFYGDKK